MLKSKITCLEKEETRTATNIEKVFTSSIPIIKSKILQSHQLLEVTTDNIQNSQARNSLSTLSQKKEEFIHVSREKQQR